MTMERIEILKYNKYLLKRLFLWPDVNVKWYHIKDTFHWITTLPLIIPIIFDIYMSVNEPDFKFQDITENCIEIATIVTAAYMLISFKLQKHIILDVVTKLEELQRFHNGKNDFLTATEEHTRKLTKYFFHFVFWTNPLYALIPLMNYRECQEHRLGFTNLTQALDYFPCGLDFKSRFPFDVSSAVVYWSLEALEYYCSVVTTVTGVVLTTFMCSVLLFLMSEIQCLKRQIDAIYDTSLKITEMERRRSKAVDFHKNIIICSKMINTAFGPLLFMHFIITGFSISILAVNLLSQPLRYTAEIFGWILILLLPSTYGQRLLNESEDIANVAYNSNWYNVPVNMQKDVQMMIMISRKALCLQSMNFGIFCHSTFVMVLKSAYSFFTLMVQK